MSAWGKTGSREESNWRKQSDLESGGPPEAGTEGEFLGIDPIGDAVAQGVGAVFGEAGFPGGGDVDGVEVPAASESDHAGIGREFGIEFGDGRLGELLPLGGIGVDGEEIAASGIEDELAV
jgi:hypothetical protein